MHHMSNNMVLLYENGQFTFRHFDHTANDAALFALGKQINAFQDENDVARIVKVQVYSVL